MGWLVIVLIVFLVAAVGMLLAQQEELDRLREQQVKPKGQHRPPHSLEPKMRRESDRLRPGDSTYPNQRKAQG